MRGASYAWAKALAYYSLSNVVTPAPYPKAAGTLTMVLLGARAHGETTGRL